MKNPFASDRNIFGQISRPSQAQNPRKDKDKEVVNSEINMKPKITPV